MFSLAVCRCSSVWRSLRPGHSFHTTKTVTSVRPPHVSCLSLNVQITQPYCPCCQFCHPVSRFLPTCLPTYLPTCLLPLCLLAFLPPALPFLYACSSNGGGWKSASLLSRLTKLSVGVLSCGHIFICVGSKKKKEIFKKNNIKKKNLVKRVCGCGLITNQCEENVAFF